MLTYVILRLTECSFRKSQCENFALGEGIYGKNYCNNSRTSILKALFFIGRLLRCIFKPDGEDTFTIWYSTNFLTKKAFLHSHKE